MVMPANEVMVGRQNECIQTAEELLGIDGGEVNLFTITGGIIILTGLVGIVTSAITATTSVIFHLHTADGDMCLAAGGTDVVSVAGSQITITGDPTVACVLDATGFAATLSFATIRPILGPSTISMFTVDTSADSGMGATSAIRWSLVYTPLTRGAYVVLA